MWKPGRREEDELPARPEPAVPTPSYTPTPRVQDQPRSEMASIGKSVVVKGELSGSEDLFVDGEVEGSVSLRGQTLTVGPNGRVRANVEARNVIVHGRVDGDVHATDRVELRKTASLSGDITTARISIEDGAFFKGTIDIQKPESATKPEIRPTQTAVAVGSSTSSTPSTPATSPAVVSGQGSLLDTKKF